MPNKSSLFVNYRTKIIVILTFLIITGFVPLEEVLPIQINNRVLSIFTDFSVGLFGLIGLCIITILYIRERAFKYSFLLVFLLGLVISISGFLLIIAFVTPDFKWKDEAIYQGGNEYLILQEQETFVTGDLTPLRIIRTRSTNSIIRLIEDKRIINSENNIDPQKSKIYFDGKSWRKMH